MKSTFLNKPLTIAALGVIIFLSSCQSTIPFTNSVKTKYNLDEAKLKKMQFYVSSDVTLQRGAAAENSQELDKDGKLVVSTSASLDNILIEAETPGVCVKVLEGDKIAVSFFETDDEYLVFEKNIKSSDERYFLSGAMRKNGVMKINFAGKVYQVAQGGMSAYLKFEMKKVKDFKSTSQKAKGRKVN